MRVALIGWGAINQAVAPLLDESIEVVAVARRDWSGSNPGLPETAAAIASPGELALVQPDLVAEAAGRESVAEWGFAALDAGADFVISSVSALADTALLASLRERAQELGRQVRIQSGALAGVDALTAARLIGIDAVEHRIVKPPQAWLGTPAEDLCDLDALTEATTFFEATAGETATAFPKNANVAMTTALAGIGPDQTRITLIADPTATTNRHELEASGAFGELAVSIANKPLPSNPKTSALAALSLARTINGDVAPLVV